MDPLPLSQMTALDALLQERNVRRAAERSGVTQSAMSHALRQLREALGDPLLLRSGNAMLLTPRAEAIRAPLHHALAQVRAAVAARPGFDAKTSTRRFSIACSDAVAVTLIPRLARDLWRAAPGVGLELRPLGLERVPELLEAGELDLLVTPVRPAAPGLKAQALYRADWRVVCNRSLTRGGAPLDLDRYCALPHAIIGAQGPGVVDEALAKLGRTRRVTLVIPYFMAASAILEATDHLVTLPDGLAEQIVRGRRLVRFEPPLRLPTGRVFAVWHERFDHEPGARWLRERVLSAARELGPAS
ncbi:MAG TPA: LysR family transcriptional regulator [Kofleriaceae bacterium]|nr:LysR family transcriptional regulator [Kofleriaceae bacterium]